MYYPSNVCSNPQMFKGKIMFACDLFLINVHSTCNLARWQRKKFQVFGVAKRGGEMIPTLVVDWRPSAVRGEEVRHFHEVAGMSIVIAGGPQQTLLTVDS